jgi:hypothetical protein
MVKYPPYTRRSIFIYFTVYAGGLYHGYNRRFAGEARFPAHPIFFPAQETGELFLLEFF